MGHVLAAISSYPNGRSNPESPGQIVRILKKKLFGNSQMENVIISKSVMIAIRVYQLVISLFKCRDRFPNGPFYLGPFGEWTLHYREIALCFMARIRVSLTSHLGDVPCPHGTLLSDFSTTQLGHSIIPLVFIRSRIWKCFYGKGRYFRAVLWS
jgi:hypothetical protein